jgi:hypothetical protein
MRLWRARSRNSAIEQAGRARRARIAHRPLKRLIPVVEIRPLWLANRFSGRSHF